MAFLFNQAPNSPQISFVPATVTLHYIASGEDDATAVSAYAQAFTSPLYSHPSGEIIYKQDIKVSRRGFKLYDVEIPYSTTLHYVNTYQLSFDTTGGTIHISSSKQTLGAFGSGATINDHGQSIGVSDATKDPEGADIIIPVLKLTATARSAAGVITLPAIRFLARLTGKVNSDYFLGFEPGEVLYLGCTGQEGTDQQTEVQHHFACQENLYGLSVGGINNISKRGHDLYWIQYKAAIANNIGTRQPKAVYVERVYDYAPLGVSLGFG